MILKNYSIEYEKIATNFNVILIYGENYYLKNEILQNFTKIFEKKSFKIKLLNEEDILSNGQLLDDYLNQDNLFGEKEILIIQKATDKLLNYIDIKDIKKKLILISDNLTKKSQLRNISEKDKLISCIPCYDDDEKTLKSLLQSGLKKLNIQIPFDQIDMLFNSNKLNRSDINNGLKQLALIVNEKKIDVNMFQSLFNTTSAFDSFEITNALLCCDKKKLSKIFGSFYNFSINFNELLGPLKYKINKLIDIYNFNKSENNIARMVDNYKPPIFWKEKNITILQLNSWSAAELDLLLDKINEIEILCKLNYEIAETIFNKFLLDIVSKKVLINKYF